MENYCCHNNGTRRSALRCSEVKYRIKDKKLLFTPADFTEDSFMQFSKHLDAGERTVLSLEVLKSNWVICWFCILPGLGAGFSQSELLKTGYTVQVLKKSNRTVGYMKSTCSVFNQYVLKHKVCVSKTKNQKRQQQHKMGCTTFSLISFCNTKREQGEIQPLRT